MNKPAVRKQAGTPPAAKFKKKKREKK